MNGSDKDSDYEFSQDNWPKPSDDSNSSPVLNDNVHFKILVPSIAAGAIIGKGGEAIAQIQKETSAKVKMSKANDFYPGTTERVCLILGTVESITKMHNYIMEKILEKADTSTKSQTDNRMLGERHKQVKILVPNSTAGMIIGKGGAFIKEIKETSGAFIQISQKSREINLPERCIVIAGELDQNKSATSAILAKIAEDPQSASCPNISYADSQGPVASAYPTGSPYANSATSVAGTGAGGGVQVLQTSPVGGPPPQTALYSPGSTLGLQLMTAGSGPTTPGAGGAVSTATGALYHGSPPHHHPHQHHAAAALLSGIGPPSHAGGGGGHFPTPPHHYSGSSAASTGSSFRGGPGSLASSNIIAAAAAASTMTTSPTSPGSSAGPNMHPQQPSNMGASFNMDNLREALHFAGYPANASQEIAAAMQVLDKYGFINTSVLAGGGNTTAGNQSNSASSTPAGPSSLTGIAPAFLSSPQGAPPLAQHPSNSAFNPLTAAAAHFHPHHSHPHQQQQHQHHHHSFSPGSSSNPGMPPSNTSATGTSAASIAALFGASPPSFGGGTNATAAALLSPGSSYNFGHPLFHGFSGGPASGSGGAVNLAASRSQTGATGAAGSDDHLYLVNSPPDMTAAFPLYSPPLHQHQQQHYYGQESGGGILDFPHPGRQQHNSGGGHFSLSPPLSMNMQQTPWTEQSVELPDEALLPRLSLENILRKCDVLMKRFSDIPSVATSATTTTTTTTTSSSAVTPQPDNASMDNSSMGQVATNNKEIILLQGTEYNIAEAIALLKETVYHAQQQQQQATTTATNNANDAIVATTTSTVSSMGTPPSNSGNGNGAPSSNVDMNNGNNRQSPTE